MRRSLPSQFDSPETPKAEQPTQKAFLKIAGTDRAVTADAIDLVQGAPGDVRIQLSDGAVLQVRKFDPEELVRLLSQHLTSPLVAVRSRSASGRVVFLNPDKLTGCSTVGTSCLVYFGMSRPVHLDGGYLAADVQTALEAAGRVFVTVEPAPPAPILRSAPEVSELPAYDIDRYAFNSPGRV